MARRRRSRCRHLGAWLVPILSLAAASPVFAQEAPAEPRASGEITLDVGSGYVWRGQRLSRGTVAQSLVAGEYRGFAASVWSNYDPSEYPRASGRQHQITETDLTVSYEHVVRRGTLTGGFIYYSLRGARDTSELFVGYELDLPLRPSAKVYLDADEGRGAFVVAGAGQSLSFPRDVSLDLELEAGFNLGNRVMGTDANGRPFSGPYHGDVSASATIPVWRRLAIAAGLGFSFPLGGRAAEAIASSSYLGSTRSCVYGSLGLTAAFAPAP